MKFGDEFIGRIESFDEKGRGIASGCAIPFTAPGDEVVAAFLKRQKGLNIAKLKQVTKRSPDRVPTPCPHAGVCGGCLWQHLSYDAQLKTKERMINAALERAGHDERITHVIASPNTLHYRNRMDYVVGWKGELGLKEYGSWSRYLNLTTCLLLDDATPQILQAVHELMDELKLEPWDAKKYTGLLRYCVIRIGRNTNERMITLVVKDVSRITQHIERIKEKLVPFCTTLYLGENPEITDLSYAKTFTLLHGNTYLTEEVNGLHYRIHPNSFFQTNTDMASVLQTTVLKKLGDAKSVLDLYCGLGFFGIAAAKQGKTVYGHELDAPAIELAKTNAELNGVRADFGAGPVEKLDWKSKKPDAVIVDPPRAGLHPKALQALMENAPPTIIYVSCNFHRLVEELKQLKSVYRVASIEALDLFPQTPHVEVVTQLIRR